MKTYIRFQGMVLTLISSFKIKWFDTDKKNHFIHQLTAFWKLPPSCCTWQFQMWIEKSWLRSKNCFKRSPPDFTGHTCKTSVTGCRKYALFFCAKQFKSVLSYLVKSKILSTKDCDKTTVEFNKFCEEEMKKLNEEFKKFD